MSINSYSLYPFGPPAQAAAPPGLPPQNVYPNDPHGAYTPHTGGFGGWIAAPIPFGGNTVVVTPK